jgi:prephenate dehydratase
MTAFFLLFSRSRVMRIAYQGESGAYSEAAALAFKPSGQVLPCRTFEGVFAAVGDGTATHGVLPLENSVGGSIHRNYDLLVEHELPIVGEVEVLVEHCLVAAAGVGRGRIRRVFSHPQGLAQCEGFLRGLPDVELVATYDTAGSAKLIRDEGLRDTAAIASARAAAAFGLEILERGIQDYAANVTRFVVIARTAETRADADRTTIVFALPNTPGALFRALSVFALREIDLLKLESRPIRGRPWEYLFHADLHIGRHEPRCGHALVHLAEFARWVRTLGSYPRWKPPASQAPTTNSAIPATTVTSSAAES